MNRTVLLSALLRTCVVVALGQANLSYAFAKAHPNVEVPDTIYVYETVTVYDTIRISDTLRVKKATVASMRARDNFSMFLSHQTATFSGNDIIVCKNHHQKQVKTMKFNVSKFIGAVTLTTQSIIGISAQERPQETDSLQKFPMQLSLVYPMSTHGVQTEKYHYNLSLNLLTGKTGAVTGLELGGLMNRTEGDLKGVQMAGLFNMAKNVSGIQYAGFGNIAESVRGVQTGGWGNISGDVTGIQTGGLGNISGNVTGIQTGGLGNISGNIKGIQMGGLGNISGNITGIQLGGLANVSGLMHGLQLSGLANVNAQHQGIQMTGIANVTGEIRGFQVAGVGNISDKVSGFSLSGLFNRTGTLNGFELGIVNITDTIESGVSMALINIVKKGFYSAWELTFADYLNVGLSYKAGIQRFYTIYTIGSTFLEDKLWVAGIGFGNRTALGSRIDFQPEIISYNYYPINFKNMRSSWAWATHLKLGFIYNISDRLGILVAPSIYHFNGKQGQSGSTDAYKPTPISPLWSHAEHPYRYSLGVGLSVGLVLK